MARSSGLYIPVDYGHFLSFIRDRGWTIRDLAEDLDVQDKSIRRAKETGKIPISLALDICEKLGSTFSETFGKSVDLELRDRLVRTWK